MLIRIRIQNSTDFFYTKIRTSESPSEGDGHFPTSINYILLNGLKSVALWNIAIPHSLPMHKKNEMYEIELSL